MTCSWRFLISNKLEQLEFKFEKIIGIQKHAGKARKYNENSTLVFFRKRSNGTKISKTLFHVHKNYCKENRLFLPNISITVYCGYACLTFHAQCICKLCTILVRPCTTLWQHVAFKEISAYLLFCNLSTFVRTSRT